MNIPVLDPILTGLNIKTAIKSSGIKIQIMADMIGLSDKSTLYKYMRGDVMPSIDMLLAISAVTNTSLDMLIGKKLAA